MDLPLYLIAQSDDIPIPDTHYRIDVPYDSIHRWRTSPIGNKHQILIGVATDEDVDNLYEDIKKISIYTHDIGVLATVVSAEEADSFVLYTLYIESRVYFRQFLDCDGKISVEYEELSEDFLPGEENLCDDLLRLINVIEANQKLFSAQLVEAISAEDFLITKMNIIADYILKESEDRLAYLQSSKHIDRWQRVLDRAETYIESPPVDKKKTVIRNKKKIRVHNADSIKARFKNLIVDEEIKEHLEREISKLDSLPKSSTEHSMVLDYMSWVLDLPWSKYSQREIDLDSLVHNLNTSHYGLEDVKQHVLEHMTIEKIKGGSTGTVLCFVGPPGTGKTSIAKQIAASTNRYLARVALGGLTDEAEIRGHRRTYIGARPGRLVVGLKQAGSLDPVFLLDEIDKLGISGKGDPASALLEVLDKEQNDNFIDRYLEVPIDLSRAMFICTANYEEQIPLALKDRMEFIYFRSYTKEERLIITTQHLIPKAFTELSLDDFSIAFAPEAIEELASSEQIRDIEKRIRKVLRIAAVDLVVHKTPEVIVDKTFMKRLPAKFLSKQNAIGF